MLVDILQYTGEHPTTKSHLIQNTKSAKVEKPWFKDFLQHDVCQKSESTENTHGSGQE